MGVVNHAPVAIHATLDSPAAQAQNHRRVKRDRLLPQIIVTGCGYVGERVAAREQSEGNPVVGIVRSRESAQQLRQKGIEVRVLDLDHRVDLSDLPTSESWIYYFIAPPPAGQTDPRLERFLNALLPGRLPARIVLISTTGVYGDCQGQWVTEDTPPHPQADRAKRRLAAENALRAWANQTGTPYAILRVPGIYGPDRSPLKRLREGEPVLRETESPYSNRVHIDDLVAACLAAQRQSRSGAVYNICDGHPSTMTDYFFKVADACGLPRPPQIGLREAQAQLSSGILSYLAESKRLDNRRMREELGVIPRYPDLESGLAACVGARR